MKEGRVALVLSGGGARGALQVGALKALLEQDWHFDLVVGTSVGALNAVMWGYYGAHQPAWERLRAAWLDAAEQRLLFPPSWRMLMRLVLRKEQATHQLRLRKFLIDHGLSPHLRFEDIRAVEVRVVSADLCGLRMVVHGDDPKDRVVESVLASTALVPWMPPVKSQGRELMDGGMVSNVPVEVAVRRGATHLVVLDVFDERVVSPHDRSPLAFLWRVTDVVARREFQLEMALADLLGAHVLYAPLRGPSPVPVWDFSHTELLMETGYQLMRRLLDV